MTTNAGASMNGDDIADPMLLTFAELEYLLAESATWPQTRRVLALGEPENLVDVQAAGLASLLARNLASMEATGVRLSLDTATAAALIGARRLWVEYLYSAEQGRIAGGFGVDDENQCILLSVAAPGVFEVAPLVADPDPGHSFSRIAAALFERSGTLLVVARPDGTDPAAVAINVDEAGAWSWRDPTHNEAVTHADRQAAIGQAAALVHRALSAQVAS